MRHIIRFLILFLLINSSCARTDNKDSEPDYIAYLAFQSLKEGNYDGFIGLFDPSVIKDANSAKVAFNHYKQWLVDYDLPEYSTWQENSFKIEPDTINSIYKYTVPFILGSTDSPEYFAILKISKTSKILSFTILENHQNETSHDNIKRPELRDSFKLFLKEFNSVRLFNSYDINQVRHFQSEFSNIDNKEIFKDIEKLIQIINSSEIEKSYVSTNIDVNGVNDVKVLFLKDTANRSFEILVTENNPDLLTIREYYYLNSANYYDINIDNKKAILEILKTMIEKYTTHNTR